MVHADVKILQTNQSFNLTVIYGYNYGGDRRFIWSDLLDISPSIHLPWLVIGDFNVTRFSDERTSGAPPNITDIEEFNSCITSCDLKDLNTIGNPLSWSNRASEKERKFARLNRALVNDLWLLDHPISFAEYKAPAISDHSPILVYLKEHKRLRPKPFRFMNMRLDDASLYPIVERAWTTKLPIVRSALEEVQHKLANNPSCRTLIEENQLREELIVVSNRE
ncbi:uncharacterized protein LOC143856685 [Tasmannia lanceolata]|uniref:uncharacterized protein LOC143856685 n=1 Tax=Tasmannia lanceolata TaxID=3420 RepID=UPI004064BAAE